MNNTNILIYRKLDVSVQNVPGAEVNPGILNVGFGDVGNHGVTDSEAAYIGRGAARGKHSHPQIPPSILFFSDFQGGYTLTIYSDP